MHVLGNIGHSFSQRRKTHKPPKSLHIRKVSFSGCSLSSGSSFSSSSSSTSATMRAPLSARTTSSASSSSSSSGFNPLSAHPTFQPPPRLHDRPLISPVQSPYQPMSTFFDDSTDEEFDPQSFDEEYAVGEAQVLHLSHPSDMKLPPPHSSPMNYPVEPSEPQDYFMLKLATTRPPMLRSRWSESTIQTLDQDLSADELDETSDSEAHTPVEIPNFSHKRNVTPQRPPMRSLDSLEDFMKRGGWKRKGVVLEGVDYQDES